ncbi:hypothetical protein [Methylotuvimicrobium sp. KM2]|jgi:type II secretory pathway pseudopilin PulG|uniref:hypothetical protein n=1 Tax=Methylotuvimicrobium sp. KM2 TaxID=3133976 RepID=UPI0031014904
MKRCSGFLQRGLTLLELSVVLLVLIALAGLMVPYVVGTGQMAMCQATDATMHAVKEAIMGGSAGPGFYADTLGYYPKNSRNSDLTDINLTYLFKPGEFESYNPKTAVGWRGPYLQTGGVAPASLDASFTDTSEGKVHQVLTGGQEQVLDAWGKPIVLQIPIDTNDSNKPNFDYARLVSAGRNGSLDTAIAYNGSSVYHPDASDRNDDRVLYLRMPDPDHNEPCDSY